MADGIAQELRKILHGQEAIALVLQQIENNTRKNDTSKVDDPIVDTTSDARSRGAAPDRLSDSINTLASAIGATFTMDKQGANMLSEKVTPIAPREASALQQRPLPRVGMDDPGTAADEDGTSRNSIPEAVVDEKGDPPDREITNWKDLAPIIGEEFSKNRKEEAEAARLEAQKGKEAALASPEGGGGGMMAGLLGMAAVMAAVVGKKLLGMASKGVSLIKRGFTSAAKHLGRAWGGIRDKWNSLWGKDKPQVVNRDGARAFRQGTGSRAPTVTAKEIPKKMPWYKRAWEGTKGAASRAWKGAGQIVAKAGGKSLLKKIPGVGLVAGGIFGAQRALQGDWAGAGAELASGAASTVPGLGTAGSVAIDAGLAARDIAKEKEKEKQAEEVNPISVKPTPGKTSSLIDKDAPIIIPESKPTAVQPWFPKKASIAKPKTPSTLSSDTAVAGAPTRGTSSIVMSKDETPEQRLTDPPTREGINKETVTDIVRTSHEKESSVITQAAEKPDVAKKDEIAPVGEDAADISDDIKTAGDTKSPKDKLTLMERGVGFAKSLAQRYMPGADKEKDAESGDDSEKLTTIEQHLAAMHGTLKGVDDNIAGMRREFPESIAAIPTGGSGNIAQQQNSTPNQKLGSMTQDFRNMNRPA